MKRSLDSLCVVVGQFCTQQFGTEEFGTRTIWHQDSKNGQFGTKIVKMDNLAPRRQTDNLALR